MDSKSRYQNEIKIVKKAAQNSESLSKLLEESGARCAQYKPNWQSVDINEVVERFAPGSKPVIKGVKVIFYNSVHTIAVVADAIGGYLRIEDLSKNTKKRQYLTLDGKDAHNVTENGKTRGRSKDEFQRATHFTIRKRDEKNDA